MAGMWWRALGVLGSLVLAALIVLGYYLYTAPPELGVHEGEMLPDLELEDFTGKGRLRLSALREKPVVIVVFDTAWPATVPYLKQIERLRALYLDRGLVVVGISTDAEKDTVDNLMRTQQINFYVLRDPGGLYVRSTFGSPTPPTPDTFVVAPGGRLVAVYPELVNWRNAFERRRVEAILPPTGAGSTPPAAASP
jgi:peroxiredoxin